MAKEKKEMASSEVNLTSSLAPRKKKRKKWIGLLVFLVILVGVGVVGVLFKDPIMAQLRKMPIVGTWIPEATSAVAVPTMEELQAQVATNELELNRLKAQVSSLEEENQSLTLRNDNLQQYETMYLDFVNQKEAWDESVASTNPDLFIQQFESFYPDTAERLYQAFKPQAILTSEQKKLSKTIAEMDEDQAASAIALLVSTDSSLVQTIFEGMAVDRRALILSAMNTASAAQVIKLIAPDENIAG